MPNNRNAPVSRPTLLRRAIAIGAATALAAPVLAQGKIEEIVVTAQKRVENVQEVPIAITTLSTAQLETEGIFDFDDIVGSVPSLMQTPYPSANILILYMRGQGVSDPMQITADGSVGLYLDGHYIARPQGALFDLADTERIEVLRGPQGTLYGRNTTGGAINLITRKPSGEFGFKQNLSIGSRDLVRSLTTIDLPEAYGVSSKVTVLRKTQDGFVKNLGGQPNIPGPDFWRKRNYRTGLMEDIGSRHDFGGETDEIAGRVALHWSPCNCDTFDVDYAYDVGSQDSTPIYYQATLPAMAFIYPGYKLGNHPVGHTYRPLDLPVTKTHFKGHGLTLTWQAADNLTIKSLTGYRDLGFNAPSEKAEAFTVTSYSIDKINSHEFSQEFQFIGNVGDSIDYVAGLYYFHENSNHFQYRGGDLRRIARGTWTWSDRFVTSETTSHAAYGQLTWTPPVLDNRLDLTFGGRFTKDRRKARRDFVLYNRADPLHGAPVIAESGLGNSQSFSRFNPAFIVSYDWSDTVNSYAKVTTGYKAGGSSEGAGPGRFDQTFKPEDVTTWELGLKSDWLDNSLRLNAAAFYSQFDDMQLAFVADPIDTSIIQAYNAGKAIMKGAELELTWLPITDLQLKLDYTWLDPRFDEVKVRAGTIFDPAVNRLSPYSIGEDIKDLFVMPYAPRNSYHASVDYTFWRFEQAELSLNLNYHYQSDNYLTAPAGKKVPGRENYRQESHGILNARLAADFKLPQDHRLQVAVWGRNITEKEYRTHMIGLGGGAVATPYSGFGYTFAAVAWSEPATYGMDLIFSY